MMGLTQPLRFSGREKFGSRNFMIVVFTAYSLRRNRARPNIPPYHPTPVTSRPRTRVTTLPEPTPTSASPCQTHCQRGRR